MVYLIPYNKDSAKGNKCNDHESIFKKQFAFF